MTTIRGRDSPPLRPRPLSPPSPPLPLFEAKFSSAPLAQEEFSLEILFGPFGAGVGGTIGAGGSGQPPPPQPPQHPPPPPSSSNTSLEPPTFRRTLDPQVNQEVSAKKTLTYVILSIATVLGVSAPLVIGMWLGIKLVRLAGRMDDIATLNFHNESIRSTNFAEIDKFQKSFMQMSNGLKAFGKFVPGAVVKVSTRLGPGLNALPPGPRPGMQ